VTGDFDLAHVGAVLADETRASILLELLGGEQLPAGELARRAGVSPSAASNHLRRLLDAGFVEAVVDGRRRLYSLSGPEIAHALETLGTIAPTKSPSSLRMASRFEAIRDARTCYDHLAGRLGVELTERLVSLRLLRELDAGYEASRRGDDWLLHLDVDVTRLRLLRRRFAPKCLDLTERRPHLAGALGAALTTAVKQHRYVTNRPGSRALQVTGDGRGFFAELGIAA